MVDGALESFARAVPVDYAELARYLHARATAGWRTGRAAWINIAGFAVVAFNLFFINMVVAGLHSYAGVN